MSLEKISKIDKIKEELSSWKTQLIKNLSINTYITYDLFIISNFWFKNYEEYITNFGKEGSKVVIERVFSIPFIASLNFVSSKTPV